MKGVKIWDKGCDIAPSFGGPPDRFRVGSADGCGAAGTGLAVSRALGGGTVSGTEEGVAVVIFMVGRDAIPWHEVEQEVLSAIDGMVVPCIGSAAVPSEIRSRPRGAR